MFNGFQLILKTKYFTLKSPSVSKIINEVNVSIRTDIDPVFSCFNKFWTIFKDIEVQGGPWVKNELFASNCFLIYHLYPLTIRMRNEGLCTKSIRAITEDGSTEALLQILYSQYLILGVFGSCMF